MQPRNAEALVLRRRDLGENDRVVTLLTREYGRLDAVAKGAKKPGTRSSGASEPFTRVRVLLAHGRNLEIATQWEVLDAFRAVRSSINLTTRALYMCELTAELTTEHEPSPSVYELLCVVLGLLGDVGERSSRSADLLVYVFETRLLHERGYGISTSVCTHCGEPIDLGRAGERLGFSAAAGGVLCSRCRYALRDAFAVTPVVLQALAALAQRDLNDVMTLTLSLSAERKLRECLRWSIRYRCERELKSAAMLDMVRASESRHSSAACDTSTGAVQCP